MYHILQFVGAFGLYLFDVIVGVERQDFLHCTHCAVLNPFLVVIENCESSRALGAARRGVAHALQRRHPLKAGKHTYTRKASRPRREAQGPAKPSKKQSP